MHKSGLNLRVVTCNIFQGFVIEREGNKQEENLRGGGEA